MNYEKDPKGNETDYCVTLIHTFPLSYNNFLLLFNSNKSNHINIYGDLGLFDIDQSRALSEDEFNKLFNIDSNERIFTKSVIMIVIIRSLITGNIMIFKRITAYVSNENINCTLDFDYLNNRYINYDLEDYNPGLSAMLAYFENKFENVEPIKIWDDEIFQYKKHICQATSFGMA